MLHTIPIYDNYFYKKRSYKKQPVKQNGPCLAQICRGKYALVQFRRFWLLTVFLSKCRSMKSQVIICGFIKGLTPL